MLIGIALVAWWLLDQSNDRADASTGTAPDVVERHAGLFAALTAITWWITQRYGRSKIQCDAVHQYYSEGDADLLREARRTLRRSYAGGALDGAAAGVVATFFEKCARLVQRRMLPIWVFEGPSGQMAANMLIMARRWIAHQRSHSRLANIQYARSWAWLVRELGRLGYLGYDRRAARAYAMGRRLVA